MQTNLTQQNQYLNQSQVTITANKNTKRTKKEREWNDPFINFLSTITKIVIKIANNRNHQAFRKGPKLSKWKDREKNLVKHHQMERVVEGDEKGLILQGNVECMLRRSSLLVPKSEASGEPIPVYWKSPDRMKRTETQSRTDLNLYLPLNPLLGTDRKKVFTTEIEKDRKIRHDSLVSS